MIQPGKKKKYLYIESKCNKMLAVASSKCRSYRAQGVHPKTLLTFLDVLKYSK